MNFLKRTIVRVSDGNGYPAVKSESDERGVEVNVATRAAGKAKRGTRPKSEYLETEFENKILSSMNFSELLSFRRFLEEKIPDFLF